MHFFLQAVLQLFAVFASLLARFAVLRAAIDEATGTFGRFAAVYPRK